MNYYSPRTVAVRNVFDSEEINSNLDKFSNVLENGCLTTCYDGREVCKADVSARYYNFDFTAFSKSILSQIQNYFTPEKYSLKAASGVQEIRLVGDEIYIDNERYEKMFSIVNSTDRSRALSMNVGLVKLNKFGRIASCIILTSFSNKHYKSSLPEKIETFSKNLINFNIEIDFHVKTIEDLVNKEVSMLELAKSMLYNKDGKVIKTVDLKLRAMFKKLTYQKDLRKERRLYYVSESNISKLGDLKINAKTVFEAYLDPFNDSDASVIARESKRIIEALENL